MKNKNTPVAIILLLFFLTFCKTESKNEFYENGKLKKEVTKLDDELYHHIEYDTVGFVVKDFYLKNGKLDSICKEQVADTLIIKQYSNNLLHGKIRYYKDTMLVKSEEYYNDTLQGTIKYYDYKTGRLIRSYFMDGGESCFSQVNNRFTHGVTAVYDKKIAHDKVMKFKKEYTGLLSVSTFYREEGESVFSEGSLYYPNDILDSTFSMYYLAKIQSDTINQNEIFVMDINFYPKCDSILVYFGDYDRKNREEVVPEAITITQNQYTYTISKHKYGLNKVRGFAVCYPPDSISPGHPFLVSFYQNYYVY